MADTAIQLIQACITKLKADATVSGQVADRIYTNVPQGAAFPYVVLTVSTEPFAANSFSGSAHTLRVQVFSRQDGMMEATKIRSAVHAVLDRNESALTLSSGTLCMLQFSGMATVFREDDGMTWQAIGEFLALVQ